MANPAPNKATPPVAPKPAPAPVSNITVEHIPPSVKVENSVGAVSTAPNAKIGEPKSSTKIGPVTVESM